MTEHLCDWKSDLVKVSDLVRTMRAFEHRQRRLDVVFLTLNLVMIMCCAAAPDDSWTRPILFVILGVLAALSLARVAHRDREELSDLRVDTRVAFDLALDRMVNGTFDERVAYFEFENLTVRFRSLALWYKPPRELHERPFAQAVYGAPRSSQEPADGHRPAGEHEVVSGEPLSPSVEPLSSSPTAGEDTPSQTNET